MNKLDSSKVASILSKCNLPKDLRKECDFFWSEYGGCIVRLQLFPANCISLALFHSPTDWWMRFGLVFDLFCSPTAKDS